MFEQLINEAASRFNLSNASVSALLRGLLLLMTSEQAGGIEGFVELFRRAGLGGVLTSSVGWKDGRTISPSQLESALGASALDMLAASSGLTRTAVTPVLVFLLPKVIHQLTASGFSPSSSALLSQVSSYIDRPAVTAIKRKKKSRSRPRWLPWAAAALLALVGWLWLRGPVGTIAPQLTLNNRDGRVTYSGLVRDEATQTAIVSALRTTFGEGKVAGNLRVDANVRRARWLPRLGDLFTALKSPGVELSLTGDVINVGGWLTTTDRQAITDRLQAIFGAQATIRSLPDAAAEATRGANDKAVSALVALGTSGVTADAVVQAMNLAVINFSTGSAEIPPDSVDVIRKAGQAIQGAGSNSLTIEIGGHTDNTGDPARNMTLSQARADAVKVALTVAGAPAEILTTKGYGDTKPRAMNDTEFGRFQNRRIDYTVVR